MEVTLPSEVNVPFVELDAINNIVMGAGSEGPLLIVSNSTSKPFLFYDILTMNRIQGEFHVLGFGDDESNAYALWASVDGTVFTASKPNTSPCEMFTMLFQGDRATGHEVWEQGGYALPGMDGSFICTSLSVLSGALKPLDPEHAGMMSCVPTFADKSEGEEFGIATFRLRTRMSELQPEFLLEGLHNVVEPQAEVVKMRYHGSAFHYEQSLFGDNLLYVTKAQAEQRHLPKMMR